MTAGDESVQAMSASDVRKALAQIRSDPRYKKNIEYGQPRSGHPEGSVAAHIQDLEANLELLRPRLRSEEDYWKLQLLIHVHDSLKAEAEPDAGILAPRGHASLAREYASHFIQDADLLNMIQWHDANYALWQQYQAAGSYDAHIFRQMLSAIRDWDLFLVFIIIDGSTEGKDYGKLAWFIGEVKKHKHVAVGSSWLLPPR